jgi:GT2 family glycosyltransferase
MDVSIAIVSYNTKELLARCLESIFRKTKGVNYEVIVVDNNSLDGTPMMLEERFPQVTLICNNENRGFSRSVNQAFMVSHGDYFLILNPDTELYNNAIYELFNFMESHPDVGVVGPKILYPNERLHPSCWKFMTLTVAILDAFQITLYFPGNSFSKRYHYDYWKHNYIREVDWITGAAFMTRRDIYQKLNMLDEQFFIYSEDMDYCFKAWKAGYKVLFNPNAIVIHHHAKGGTQHTHVRQIDYYKSLHWYIKKNLNKPKAIMFRISTMIWALVYLIIRLCKSPFLRGREHIQEYLQVPLRLLLFKGHGR